MFGLGPIKWLKNDLTGYFALLLLACWRWTGVNILYFLAGLQSISTDLYEAASIDGANKWQQFTKISLPLLKPTTVYVLQSVYMPDLQCSMKLYVMERQQLAAEYRAYDCWVSVQAGN